MPKDPTNYHVKETGVVMKVSEKGDGRVLSQVK